MPLWFAGIRRVGGDIPGWGNSIGKGPNMWENTTCLWFLLWILVGKSHTAIDYTCLILFYHRSFSREYLEKNLSTPFLKLWLFYMAIVQLVTLLSCWLRVTLNKPLVEGYTFLDFPLFLKLIYSNATWGQKCKIDSHRRQLVFLEDSSLAQPQSGFPARVPANADYCSPSGTMYAV